MRLLLLVYLVGGASIARRHHAPRTLVHPRHRLLLLVYLVGGASIARRQPRLLADWHPTDTALN
jgi:hypothetical protein